MKQKFDIEDYTLGPDALDMKYNPKGNGGEHPRFTRADWRWEVADDCTLLGYWEWVFHELMTHDRK